MTMPANKALFVQMLTALGHKEYARFESYLHPQILCEWPYRVVEGFPTQMVGARRLREALEESLKVFTPYNYQIQTVYELAREDTLIAEYSSHSTYLPRNVPYSNQYIGVLEFLDHKISRWREYVNPLIVLEALGPGFTWSDPDVARTGGQT